MALVNSVTHTPDTFGALAKEILERLIHIAGQAKRIDFVVDQYLAMSIKSFERQRRTADSSVAMKITSSSQQCPKQWKKYLCNGQNKADFLRFLFSEWSADECAKHLGEKVLFITCDKLCKMIFWQNDCFNQNDVPELTTSQEEADTRLFLHANHAAMSGFNTIVIKSLDTDIEVLACHHQQHISARRVLDTGVPGKRRLVDINKVAESLGPAICDVLPSFHALTGCDNVSAFAGKGKKKAFQLLKSDPDQLRNIQLLGQQIPVQEHVQASVEKFVCKMYGSNATDINDARYEAFCKAPSVQTHTLPPTRDALLKHIARANYQAKIWKDALISNQDDSKPEENGWCIKEGELCIKWMDMPAAPAALLQLISCKCSGDCSTKKCSCNSNQLKCTDLCHCGDKCINSEPDINLSGSDSDD